MEAAAGGRVLLELPGVSIPVSLPPRLLRGQLRVLQAPEDLVLQWEPLEGTWDPSCDTGPPPAEDPPDPGYEPDWAVLSPPRPRPPPAAPGVSAGAAPRPPRAAPPVRAAAAAGGAPGPPPLHLPRGGLRALLRLLGARLTPSPRDPRLLLFATPEDPPEPPPSPGLVSRLLQGPYAATVGGLSRLLGGPRGTPARGDPDPDPDPEPPFEVIACVSLGPRPSPPRGPPVAREEWGRSHDSEGRSLDPEALRERIFRGGLSPEVRPQGWRKLLGLQDWGDPETPATPETPGAPPDPERARRDDYFRMKLQWRSLSPGQLRRNSALRGYRERLERDLAQVSPAVSPSLLRDVLMTFCMFHFDLGYVRGMSEVLVPLVSVSPDEVQAFWGFCRVMDMVGDSFGPGPEGLRRHLAHVGNLLRVLSPTLSDSLGRRWRRRCSRWLQLRFQRHLGLEGTRQLCEVLWTGLPCPNFLLLVTCALLELLGDSAGDTDGDSDGDSSNGDSDSDSDSDGDTVSPPGRALQVAEVLSRAEGMFLQLAAATDLPPALQELLGLGAPPLSPPPGPPPEPPPPERPPEGPPEGPP